MQRLRTAIGLFGVTLNLTISKIVYHQNSVTLDCKVSPANFDQRFPTVLKGTDHRPRMQSTGLVELSLQDK